MALANVGLVLALLVDVLSGVGGQELFLLGQALLVGVFQFSRRHLDAAAGMTIALTVVISSYHSFLFDQSFSPGMVEAGALILLAGMVTYSSSGRRALVLVPAIFAAILYSNATTLDPTGTLVLTVLFWTCAALTTGVGLFLRMASSERGRMADEARSSERLEMARELHDVVAHHVTGMLVQAQAGRLIAERDPERAEQMFAEIEAAGSEAMASMRRLVASLRAGDDNALVSMDPRGELDELAANIRAVGYEVDLTVTELPPALGSTLVRLTREALTNCRKHTPVGTSIEVLIETDDSSVIWTVVDDGKPSTPEPRNGFGLIGLRERVEALGGSFFAGPAPGQGWKVGAVIPLSAAEGGIGEAEARGVTDEE